MSISTKSSAAGVSSHGPAVLDLMNSSGTARTRLSFAQERLWFLDQLEPNRSLYNVPTVARVTGKLDVAALRRAVEAVIMRHKALRTTIGCEGDEPFQVVHENPDFEMRLVELTTRPVVEREMEAQRLVRDEVNRPFNLEAGPLLRVLLVELGLETHLLAVTMHHIISDEWSLRIFYTELAEFYQEFTIGTAASLPELPMQYCEYATSQREWLRNEVLEKELRYWRSQLKNHPAPVELPVDRPRKVSPTFQGQRVTRTYSRELTDGLKRFACNERSTLFMVLLAGFKAWLYRYTGQEDLIVGAPIAGRNQVETEDLIGFFVNTVPLRTQVEGKITVRELLRRVRDTALDAHAHQNAPFEKVVEALQPERSTEHLPFTRLMFVLQQELMEEMQFGGVKLRFQEPECNTAKFDLTLFVRETRDGLAAQAEFACDLFDAETVGRWLEHFGVLLGGIVANPDQKVCALPLLNDAERRQLVVEWNQTTTDYAQTECVHEVFEAKAELAPSAIAVRFGEQSLSYGELNARANQVARHLKTLGIGPDMPVALCVQRSVEMVIGLLGILKAGGAYVPLDPCYPKARLEFMLTDTHAPVVLTQESVLSHVPSSSARIVCLDRDWKTINRESRQNLARAGNPENLAYIMYTSGSTGQPKGVAVPHRAVNRLVINTDYVQLDPNDRIAQVSNVSFDAATFEIWGSLLNGSQLVGIKTDVALSPLEFARELRESGITAMFLTAALFNQVAAEEPGAFKTLRTLIVGGEALDPKWVRTVLRYGAPERLLNGYGPTENTTFSCCYAIAAVGEKTNNIPIGKSIANSTAYILDANLNPVPVGVPGELFVGGAGLARGYWERPELTAERFVPSPFHADVGRQLLYRTGDRARYLADGNIEFLGRKDEQVKVRGFRVELGEVEVNLSQHPGVRECAVTVGNGTGQKRLLAYFVPASQPAPNASDLRRFLSERLPEHLVPSLFVSLDALPLTPNGKVDRKALPVPDQTRPALEKQYVAPRDDLERELVSIWEKVLRVEPIGIEDKFFELGGHSLLAVRIVSQIEKVLAKKIRLATIFQAPTIAQLAVVLKQEDQVPGKPARTSVVEIQSKGTRPPLFLVHGAGGGMFWGYANLARHLGPDQPVFGFRSRGMDGAKEFESVPEMARQYVEDLRTVQPQGPYYLGGYCFGGNVAYEMACQLAAQGEKVQRLVLLNCTPPNSAYARPAWTLRWLSRLLRNLVYWVGYIRQWKPAQRREFFRWKLTMAGKNLAALAQVRGKQLSRLAVENMVDLSSMTPEEQELWQTHILAQFNYFPQPYPGRVHLVRSPGHPIWCSFEPDYGWGALAKDGVEVTEVPAAHEKILEEPCVQAVAAGLEKLLKPNSRQAAGECVTRSGDSLISDRPANRRLSEAEEKKLLHEWTATRKPFPSEKTLVDLFCEQVQRTPEAEALVCGDTRLTYRDLAARAAVVAERLKSLGVRNQMLVGICMQRSWEMVAGLLGTLQAGAAYVPMDPVYPAERLEFMGKDAELRVVLTQRKLLGALPKMNATILCVEDFDWRAGQPKQALTSTSSALPTCRASDLAYVLYTSGSTGEPKGVALEHRSAVAFVHWAKDVFSSSELDGVLASTSICFDLSIFELFVPLSWGGKVILADNALALAKLPAANEVKLVNTVPSAIRELLRVRGVPGSVQVVNLAGEPLPTKLVDQIYSETAVRKVYDLYGPTETTTYSTFTLRRAGEPPSIGRPLTNEQVYLLDEGRELVPIGAAGEVYIGGAGLARGYLNRPELTAERFIDNPFQPGTRLYKTGDLAKWSPDGVLEYLGRIDHQVKIRGFRVELGEVEAALKKDSRFSEAVVLAREDIPGDKRLVAYLVLAAQTDLNQNGSPAVSELRAGLRQILPEYMVPSAFVFLPELPLTPNGKIDRKALPPPAPDQNARSKSLTLPRNETETKLAAIWSEVLHLEQTDIRANFLELGGHSLLAFQIIARVLEVFEAEISLADFFSAGTVETMSAGLASGRWAKAAVVPPLKRIPRDDKLAASFVQERLWFLDQLMPGSAAYNVPLALRLRGDLNLAALQRALDLVVQRHEALRTTFRFLDGQVSQCIGPSQRIVLTVQTATSEVHLRQLLNEAARKPFDLTIGPLVRADLIRLSARDHGLVIVLHHTIADGWSLAVLCRELAAGYSEFVGGPPASLPNLPVQYADFAQWQREWLQGQVLEQELSYWKKVLKGAPAGIELPADLEQFAQPTGRAGQSSQLISPEIRLKLHSAAQAHEATPFMLLLSALATTLYRWTGQTDLVLGTVVANRARRELENCIGCFMNFIPLRVRLSGEETPGELFAKTKATVLSAQAHQACPFEKIVEAINPERKLNQNPLYNVGLLLQNFPNELFRAESLECDSMPVETGAALLDLRFEAEESAAGLLVRCEYKTDLFQESTIAQLLASFAEVLSALLDQPQCRLAETRLSPALETRLTCAPKARETVAITATFTAEPLSDVLQYWFRELDRAVTVTFAPYNQVFQQLLDPGSLLSGNHQGVNVVLVRLEDWQRSGGLATGAIQDIERTVREFILAVKAAAARHATPYLIVLCPHSATEEAGSQQAKKLLRLERSICAQLESVSGVYVVRPEDLFRWYPVPQYLDPTSDELGHVPYTPLFYTALGTLIARKFDTLHRAPYKVIALDCDQTLWGGVCGEDGPGAIRSDGPWRSLQEFMRTQHDTGMLLCLCSKNNEQDVQQVFRQRRDMPLRREHFVASRLNWRPKPENLRSLAEQLGLGLDSFIFIDDNPVECAAVRAECPEVVTLQLPEEPSAIPAFLNHCWVFDRLKFTSEDRARTQMYNQNRERELFRGQSLSLREFLAGLELEVQIQELTAEQLPRAAQLTQRTNQFNFTTRRRTENELQWLLRDAAVLTVQVRDRFGEYGLVGLLVVRPQSGALEVDSFLLSCRVLGRGVEHRMLARLGQLAVEKRLAWVDVHFSRTPKNKPAMDFLESVGAPFRQALNGGLLFRFPAGIVASIQFEPPDAPVSRSPMDLNSEPNIKITTSSRKCSKYPRLALQTGDLTKVHEAIQKQAIQQSGEVAEYVAPRSQLEKNLCELWQGLLHRDRVGLRDDFFKLGGHSFLAVRLFAEIEKLTGKKFPLVTLFQASTIEQLARVLGQAEAINRATERLLVPLQPHGTRPPLFLVHGAGGDVLWGYANLAGHMPPDQPVFGIKSRGQAGLPEFERLEQMAACYLSEVRAFQPRGPYYLGGYCFGGNVAYEMARQLQAQGESVAFLGLLDSAPANCGYETLTWWAPGFGSKFFRNVAFWLHDFAGLPAQERARFAVRKARAFGRKLKRRIVGSPREEPVDLEEVIDPRLFPEHELKLWQSHLRALAAHVQQPYAGKVRLFRTRGQPLFCSLAEDFCWSKIAGDGVEIAWIPGSHENIFVEPNVRDLAKAISACLGRVNDFD